MSLEALNWALNEGERRNLDPVQRHILMILGNRADETGYLFPSIEWIIRRTGYSRRTIQVHCRQLAEIGMLIRTPRENAKGDRTSDSWQLAMTQPGLELVGGEGGAAAAPPRAAAAPPGAQEMRPPRAAAAPNTKDYKKEVETDPRGAKAPPAGPTATAKCWQVYRDGIKRLYGVEYPNSASAQGKLSRVVALVGQADAPGVVGFYLGSGNPFYKQTQHKLDFLVRDAAQLCMQMQQAAGGITGEQAPTKSHVILLAGDGAVRRDLGRDFPIGEPLEIARQVAREYGRMIASLKPAYVMVRQGAVSARFTPQEIST